MSGTWAIYKREVKAYFASPIAYVLFTLFLLISGVLFFLVVTSYQMSAQQAFARGMQDQLPSVTSMLTNSLFGNMAIMLLLLVPILTMRLFSDEMRSGSLDLLLTMPVRDGQIIAGKFLSAVTVVVVLLGLTLIYPAFLSTITEIEWPVFGAAYLGLLLLTTTFLSVGIFTSSLTDNSIVAAFLGFGILIAFLFVPSIGQVPQLQGTPIADVLQHLSLMGHFQNFAVGVIETRDVSFYLNFTIFGLVLTFLMVQTKRWRG